MNNRPANNTATGKAASIHASDDDIAVLLQGRAKRVKPNLEASKMLEQTTREAWQLAVQQEQKRKRRALNKAAIFSTMAMAASILFAVGSVMFLPQFLTQNSTTPVVAQLLKAQGPYSHTLLSPQAEAFIVGDTLHTAQGANLTLMLPDQTLVTLDQNSRITLTDAANIRVLAGRIYVDSPDHNTSITVSTALGDIVDIGTQYQVTVAANNLEVAMREGITHIQLPGKTLVAKVANGLGDVLTINHKQQVEASQIASNAAQWQWTHKTQPDFTLNQASVSELLTWAARITGKDIVYDSRQTQKIAEQTHLSGGQIAATAISEQLPLLLTTTNLLVQDRPNAFIIEQAH